MVKMDFALLQLWSFQPLATFIQRTGLLVAFPSEIGLYFGREDSYHLHPISIRFISV